MTLPAGPQRGAAGETAARSCAPPRRCSPRCPSPTVTPERAQPAGRPGQVERAALLRVPRGGAAGAAGRGVARVARRRWRSSCPPRSTPTSRSAERGRAGRRRAGRTLGGPADAVRAGRRVGHGAGAQRVGRGRGAVQARCAGPDTIGLGRLVRGVVGELDERSAEARFARSRRCMVGALWALQPALAAMLGRLRRATRSWPRCGWTSVPPSVTCSPRCSPGSWRAPADRAAVRPGEPVSARSAFCQTPGACCRHELRHPGREPGQELRDDPGARRRGPRGAPRHRPRPARAERFGQDDHRAHARHAAAPGLRTCPGAGPRRRRRT